MFDKIKNLEKHHQFLASLIVGIGLVSLWRGIWGLMDLYIIPENYLLSYVFSTVFGIVILYLTHKQLS
ncbi:hypothetical protein A2774_05270 [Candidatus Roizmanbacteria bacterium RIFCSPHIGHO2_01_FULL_39_12c]|uniref:Uncharacterized protein n=1 Tax=Candidatus Roizmanbacteria bacterium RIFCSPHIGHO2_01_FULL_39_12c TaxID=1802031 RepID=A0A1F7GBU0_9BACT|nr:MAG: hypothetical protein A2774_05270 [Candidatus Roizmanbacteria bacterium RIFCSPHIGHO2_01_FULL_39_12c]OGK47897.1 MAG: hypothetical protein A2963_03540 [Candidatus Roizmanbacteria bacterium RIFCSPLOWO2_01_FULL_40_13]